jgi:hypothetical protein
LREIVGPQDTADAGQSAGLKRYLGERYRQLWSSIPEVGRALGQRVVRRVPRAEALKRAVRSLAIADDGVELPDWEPASESEDAAVEAVELPDDGRGYSIRCGPSGECIASWRRKVLLARGEYRLVMSARTTELVPIADEKGSGAGLRISGSARTGGLEGTADWQQVECVFRVEEEEREVVLVAELRAKRGEVCFDAGSARLYRQASE